MLSRDAAAVTCSLLISVVAAILLWKKVGLVSKNVFAYALSGGVVIGILCFSIGFFGPMFLTPSSNQGPLLGIFVTGPLGAACGLIVGSYYWNKRGKNKS